MDSTKALERVARAICIEQDYDPDQMLGRLDVGGKFPAWSIFKPHAEKAIAAYLTALSEQGEAAQPAADGWVLVPRKPTAEMYDAARFYLTDRWTLEGHSLALAEFWQSMIAASPGIASQAEEGSGE